MTTESPSDEKLLLRIQEGDHSAFATLVERHSTKYYALSYRYLLNCEEAEDMVQEAFLKLWERPDKWQANKGAKFTTWFYRIVVNMCLDKKKKQTTLPITAPEELHDPSQNQEKRTLQDEQQALLQHSITQLPKKQKTALILCIYESLSQKEAAAIMKTSEQAIQSLLVRAKKTLKQHMKKYL